MEGAHSPGSIRLAELMAALSLATDLGLGQPLRRELGVCLAALELADRLGCSTEERADVYYVALVAHVGCTGAAGLFAEWAGGDDIHFQRGAQLLGAVSEPSEDLRYLLRRFADDRPLPERVWLGPDAGGRQGAVRGHGREPVRRRNDPGPATGSARAGRAGVRATDRALGRQRAAGTGGRRADLTSAAHRARRAGFPRDRARGRSAGRDRRPSPVAAERVTTRSSSTPPSPTRHSWSPWPTFLTRGSE